MKTNRSTSVNFRAIVSHHFLVFGLCVFAACLHGAPQEAEDNSPPLSVEGDGDYFPTHAETLYESDQEGPKRFRNYKNRQASLFSYREDSDYPDSRDEDYYDDSFYSSSYLTYSDGPNGYGYPDEAGFTDEYPRNSSFEFEGGLPLLTRDFDPENAHVKIGGAYFDLLSIDAGALYSDYEGDQAFREGEEDGLLGYVGFRFRTSIRIAPSLFLTANGEIIYLPGPNRIAFRYGDTGGPLLRLSYEVEVGMWDLQIYDEFRIHLPNGLFDEGAIDRAGRYQFGFVDDRRSNGFFNEPFFVNTIGIRASRLLNEDWRLGLEADHADYWREDRHSNREHFGAETAYEGNEIPFSPKLGYDAYSFDELDSFLHRLYASGSGRLTETLRLRAGGGRFWNSGYEFQNESWIWNVGLNHELSEYTNQMVTIGQDLQVSDFSDDVLVSEYLRYSIHHEISRTLRMSAFAQWSKDEFIVGDFAGGEFDRQMYGGLVSYSPLDNLTLGAGARYEDRVKSTTGESYERWLYHLNATTQIYHQTSLYSRLQYEDTNFFDEKLFMIGVRRSF